MNAVLLIAFNRPDTTCIVFEAIRKVKPTRLYISLDAPREHHTNDIEKHEEVKKIVSNVDWPCDAKMLFQEKNLGCSLGPRSAFDWFFENEEEGIILEDDCLPHSDFFQFASLMLEKYRDNKKIISINGSNLGYTPSDSSSYTFSRFMNMWGWATWADRAKAIDYSLNEWKQNKHPKWFLYKRLKQHIFDTDISWYQYWKHKFDLTVTSQSVTWWDWQWIFHQLKNKQLSVVPSVNLVSNIGFNKDATHTRESENPAANIPTNPMQFPLKHRKKISPDFRYEEEFVKWVWCYHRRVGIDSKVLNMIKNFF